MNANRFVTALLCGWMSLVASTALGQRRGELSVRRQEGDAGKRIVLANNWLELTFDPELVDSLASKCTETDTGAREIEHILTQTFLPELEIDGAPASVGELNSRAGAWLDEQMAGRDFIAGDRFTLADILLFGFAEFGGQVGQPLDPKCENLQAWYARVAAQPAVEASA